MPLDPQLNPIYDAAGQIFNVNPDHLKAITIAESGGNPFADPTKGGGGGQGLMQIIPSTQKLLGITDPFDPVQSIFGGAQYYSQSLDKNNGDTAKALLHYNGGGDPTYPAKVAAAYAQVQQPQQPPRQATTGSQVAANTAQPLTATDAGPAVSPAPGPQQVAQAAPAGGMSEDDLANGFINGTLPFLPKPPNQPPQKAQSAPPAQGGSQGGTAGGAALDVPGLISTYNQYRTFPAGMGLANSALGMLQKMAPEGYQLNQDGSIALRQGYAQSAGQLKTAEKLGSDLQTTGAGGVVQNMPGAVSSAAEKAGAVKAAEQAETIQITRDGAMYKGGVYIGHAPKMTDVADPEGNKYPAFTPPIGPVAPGMAPPSTGGPNTPGSPSGLPPPPPGAVMGSPSELGKARTEGLQKGEELSAETYNEARRSFLGNQTSAQNLSNYLEAASKVGTGRGTNFSGNAAAWLKSAGVDPNLLALADPAQVQIMQKAANQMLSSAVRAISPRPAFADFGVLEKGLPDPEKQPEAQKQIAAAMLGRMNWENQLFKDWDADRRLTGSPSHFDMPAWVEAHPTQVFQSGAFEQMPNIPQHGVLGKSESPTPPAAPTFTEGQTIRNPTTGERRVFRGGQWAPMQ